MSRLSLRSIPLVRALLAAGATEEAEARTAGVKLRLALRPLQPGERQQVGATGLVVDRVEGSSGTREESGSSVSLLIRRGGEQMSIPVRAG